MRETRLIGIYQQESLQSIVKSLHMFFSRLRNTAFGPKVGAEQYATESSSPHKFTSGTSVSFVSALLLHMFERLWVNDYSLPCDKIQHTISNYDVLCGQLWTLTTKSPSCLFKLREPFAALWVLRHDDAEI